MARLPRLLLVGFWLRSWLLSRVRRPKRASRALTTANGPTTRATCAAGGTRRSIRSTRRISTSSRSRGDSRPTTSGRAPSTSSRARPSWSRARSTRRAARGVRSCRSTAGRASSTGPTACAKGTRAAVSPRQLSGRGVSYWTDGKGDERVVYVTTGYQLVELDAKTGAMIPSFAQRTACSI